MKTWPETRVPCAEDPGAFDLLNVVHTRADLEEACGKARRAVAVCRTCPGLAACRESGPAEHPSVKAAMVYYRPGKDPIHVREWRVLLLNRVNFAAGNMRDHRRTA